MRRRANPIQLHVLKVAATVSTHHLRESAECEMRTTTDGKMRSTRGSEKQRRRSYSARASGFDATRSGLPHFIFIICVLVLHRFVPPVLERQMFVYTA